MKFASISNDFFKLCSFDRELLDNTNRRPYLLVLKLKFRGNRQDFAIPFRSRISNTTPKDQYFSLPPRPTTPPNRVHGLHYIKMFPIRKEYLQKFHTAGDSYYELIHKIINKNISRIVQEAQAYINNYENGIRVQYATDLDSIYNAIHGILVQTQVAVTKEEE